MNLFNRVVVVLVLLALFVSTVILAILPEQMVNFIQTAFTPSAYTPLGRIVLILIAAVVGIVCVLLVYAEIKPERPKGVRLTQVKGGAAELSTESIAGRIRQAAEAMPDIRKVTPAVVSHGSRVDIRIELLANPGVDVSLKASEVVQTIRDLVERDIGVKVGKLRVNIKYDTHIAPQAQTQNQKT
ncbi:MAG: alkaline shock response membrane anchor protein AmaP [Chloroflexi bacterium]|nr:alkaline shock response membrane anchor protein AmaP [Chloroflexota bacterium]